MVMAIILEWGEESKAKNWRHGLLWLRSCPQMSKRFWQNTLFPLLWSCAVLASENQESSWLQTWCITEKIKTSFTDWFGLRKDVFTCSLLCWMWQAYIWAFYWMMTYYIQELVQFVMQIMFLNKKRVQIHWWLSHDLLCTSQKVAWVWAERQIYPRCTNVISKEDDSGQLPIQSGRFRQKKSTAKKS